MLARELVAVRLQLGHFGHAAAEAFEHLGMERPVRFAHPVVDPLAITPRLDQPRPAEVGQVPRDLGLRQVQDPHEVTDANLAVAAEQIHNPQPGPVGERPEHEINLV